VLVVVVVCARPGTPYYDARSLWTRLEDKQYASANFRTVISEQLGLWGEVRKH